MCLWLLSCGLPICFTVTEDDSQEALRTITIRAPLTSDVKTDSFASTPAAFTYTAMQVTSEDSGGIAPPTSKIPIPKGATKSERSESVMGWVNAFFSFDSFAISSDPSGRDK